MNASGVYWELDDQSIKVSGSTRLQGLVLAMTTKGKLGELNEVTAENLEEVLGYELLYNGNYLSLKTMLETVPYLEVLRINQGATRANLYDDANGVSSLSTLAEDDLLEVGQTFDISLNFAGKDTGHYVKVGYKASSFSLDVPAVASEKYTFTLSDEIATDKPCVVVLGNSYFGAIYQYDNSLIGVLGADGKVFAYKDEEVTDVEIGTYAANSLELDATLVILTGIKVRLDAYNVATKLYEFVHSLSSDGETYTNTKRYTFSLDSDSDIFVDKVDFGEIIFNVSSPSTFAASKLADYALLGGASNGELPKPGQVNFDLFDSSTANIVVLPGITDIGLVNRVAQQSERRLKSCFVGVPEFEKFSAAKAWADQLYATEYLQIGWVSDIQETEVGDIYISPAVNLFLIYANMFREHNSLNYPPAGYTYGKIAITKLMKTDYDKHLNELKTYKINYQKVGSRGPVMWEDRTRYALESDLSYANTVFILRDLREQILDFGQLYNFRYTSPTMLTTFSSGLRTILENMQESGFVAKFSLKVPSFAEAQKAGRVLRIRIGVAVMQDAQEIYFDVLLQNYADVTE